MVLPVLVLITATDCKLKNLTYERIIGSWLTVPIKLINLCRILGFCLIVLYNKIGRGRFRYWSNIYTFHVTLITNEGTYWKCSLGLWLSILCKLGYFRQSTLVRAKYSQILLMESFLFIVYQWEQKNFFTRIFCSNTFLKFGWKNFDRCGNIVKVYHHGLYYHILSIIKLRPSYLKRLLEKNFPTMRQKLKFRRKKSTVCSEIRCSCWRSFKQYANGWHQRICVEKLFGRGPFDQIYNSLW